MTNAATNVKSPDCSSIALDKFIQATRDSGYKSTAAALSELVDNSIQAAATRIAITVAATTPDDDNGIEVSILDNGLGMVRIPVMADSRSGHDGQHRSEAT